MLHFRICFYTLLIAAGVSRGSQLPIKTYTIADGLASNRVQCIAQDSHGFLWFGTSEGLSRFDGFRFVTYSRDQGLPHDRVQACFAGPNDQLWVATARGLVRFDPTGPGETAISDLRFNARQGSIRVEFAGLSFATGDVLRYQYRLIGMEREWSGLSDQLAITYANLPPRAYRFEVRAVNTDRIGCAQPAAVEFRVVPPIWRRWWFDIPAVLSIAGAVVLLHHIKVAHLLDLERVRTRIATDLHDDVGASLSQIAVLSEVARAEAAHGGHCADEPLARIAEISGEVVDNMSEIVWAVNPRNDRVRDLAQHMREYAGDVLVPQSIRFGFDTSDIAQDQRLGMDERRQIFLIFKECLHNVVRHAACAQVSVELNVVNDWLILRVSDNGKGFDLATGLGSLPARGHGLRNMCNRAHSLGGRLEIIAARGCGVTTVLRVPLPRRLRLWFWHPPKLSG